MRMIYKQINWTEIVYHVLDPPGNELHEKRTTIPRKIPLPVAVRIVKRSEGNRVVQQTIEIRQYKRLYRMPWDEFLAHAEIVEPPPEIKRGTA